MAQAKIGNKTYTLIKALTDEQKASGLLNMEINDNEGLLMIYNEPATWSIHTVGMAYPIDVIWLDANNTIVDMKKNQGPGKKKITPSHKALYVIELKAGQISRSKAKINDTIEMEVI